MSDHCTCTRPHTCVPAALPDVLFQVARLFVRAVTVKALVGSVCFVHKIAIKVALKKLVPWNGLDEAYKPE